MVRVSVLVLNMSEVFAYFRASYGGTVVIKNNAIIPPHHTLIVVKTYGCLARIEAPSLSCDERERRFGQSFGASEVRKFRVTFGDYKIGVGISGKRKNYDTILKRDGHHSTKNLVDTKFGKNGKGPG